MVTVFDDRKCKLGEGLLWHPLRKQLFWFDILSKKLFSRINEDKKEWQFNEMASAAGWIYKDNLLIAFETNLSIFNLETSKVDKLIALEEKNFITRSNDGRADPWGGFWIGTMGKNAEAHAGKIYRFFEGKLEIIYDNITVSNSICFSPDKLYAYFTDTFTNKIMRQALSKEGWPKNKPDIFIDMTREGINPDGSVIDAEGCLWNAQWGTGKCSRYDSKGNFLEEIILPASQITCPSFGGEDFKTLYLTSASIGLESPENLAGSVFKVKTQYKGQKEHQVIL
jgi:sugar lactone lactonase YvrE